jgi:hypothetical protein
VILRRRPSHLVPPRVERGGSHVHPRPWVRLVAGRLHLDAQRVHHSGGSLRDVRAAAFAQLRPEPRPLERVPLLGPSGGGALELLRERGARELGSTRILVCRTIRLLVHESSRATR